MDAIFYNRLMRFLARTWVLVVLFVAMAVLMTAFQLLQRELGIEILDVLPRYDVGEYIGHMVVYSDNQAIGLYQRSIFTLDLAFPIVYLLFYVGLIVRLADRPWIRAFTLLPLAMFLADLAENIQIYWLLEEWPRISPQAVAAASQTTEIKWLLAIPTMSVIGILILWRGVPFVIRKLGGK